MTEEQRLSREEEEALSAMRSDAHPPGQIEDAVVSALKRDGLIAKPRRQWVGLLASAAAVVLAFLAGLNVPREPSAPPAGEPRFAIFLYSGDRSPGTPSRRGEYEAWARGVAAHGTAISGEELVDDAADADGPRGYFIVSARDADAAGAIAATCPHLKYGGRVVVRKIVS